MIALDCHVYIKLLTQRFYICFRMTITRNAVFSCFDNFVSGDKYGTPTFCPMHKALRHLRGLLVYCLEHVKTLMGEVCIKEINHNL